MILAPWVGNRKSGMSKREGDGYVSVLWHASACLRGRFCKVWPRLAAPSFSVPLLPKVRWSCYISASLPKCISYRFHLLIRYIYQHSQSYLVSETCSIIFQWIHVYIYIYIHIWMCVQIYIYIYIYITPHTHMFICVYTYKYICICIYIRICIRIRICICIYICICIFLCMCAYIYIYICIYVYIYIYIYICYCSPQALTGGPRVAP